MGVQELSLRTVSEAVIRIRSSKLPDPAEIGNAGSFFKNPTIEATQFAQLKQRYDGIIGYENQDGSVKLAAGWLIEQCGWKGYRKGDAGCHDRQALVLLLVIEVLRLRRVVDRSREHEVVRVDAEDVGVLLEEGHRAIAHLVGGRRLAEVAED